jgi:hypothetical protein
VSAKTKAWAEGHYKHARIGLHACRGLAALSGFLLYACYVYDECPKPRAHPGGGVTVQLNELDVDGGE